jgi:endonuclease G
MPIIQNKLPILALCFFSVSAQAASSNCPQNYASGQAPDIVNQKLNDRAREICFHSIGLVHSGLTRTPLWSAEYLTSERIREGMSLPRQDSFHAEYQLPENERAELDDFKRSGWDRGHMSPNKDQANASDQADSFSLANIVPQSRHINQNLWEGVEASVRSYVMNGHSIYVITGPIFEGSTLSRLNGRILVPSHVFKAIYDPQTHAAGAYIATNEKDSTTSDFESSSIAALERRIGIRLFPAMSDSIREHCMDLPTPMPHGHHSRNVKSFKRYGQ